MMLPMFMSSWKRAATGPASRATVPPSWPLEEGLIEGDKVVFGASVTLDVPRALDFSTVTLSWLAAPALLPLRPPVARITPKRS